MRTFILATILALGFCLCSLQAEGQTEYRIDQQLAGDISRIQVYSGWNVRLIHDTVNMLSIATPCEYYFTEGNEPQISRQQSDGWLYIWRNTSMPKGTMVEVHYRHPLQRLDVHPGATVSADTLLMFNTEGNQGYGDINVKRGATLRVKELRCRGKEKGQPGFLSIDADTAATVRIGTVRAGHLMLWSRQETTLMLDSIDAREVDYRRDPLAHDNLWHSIPDRNIKVSTRNRWFMKGLKQLNNTIGLAFNAPYEQRYNNPYASNFDIAVIVGLKTNVIPMNQRLGLSLGIDFGIPIIGLQNNVSRSGRILTLDTVSPGVNRQHSLMNFYFGLPVKLHYIPSGNYFADLHFGLEPRWNFFQRYYHSLFESPRTQTNNANNSGFGESLNVYNPLQIRAELGFSINPFSEIEFNFFVDLLPTYRRNTGMGHVHTFGFGIRF
ncbi:MAG: hypothetical protein K6E96_06320 [Bacteroidales bacterium]|nr:hypothetical protein [Bacteroidales bacterium]